MSIPRGDSAPPARVEVGGRSWDIAGAQIAVVQAGRVLLQFRPFPPGWELPGGHVERGEDPAGCAAREAWEEAGLDVRVDGLVGVYRWAGLRHHADALYWGTVVSGSPRRTLEGWAHRWVLPSALPRTTFPWFRDRVWDATLAAHGAAPVMRTQAVTMRHVLFFGSSWAADVVDTVLGPARRRRRSQRPRD